MSKKLLSKYQGIIDAHQASTRGTGPEHDAMFNLMHKLERKLNRFTYADGKPKPGKKTEVTYLKRQLNQLDKEF